MVIEKFLQYIEFKGLSFSKVERDLGLSNGYLGKQRDRNASIGSAVIEKIVEFYPDINIQWLITGEGEMIKDQNQHAGTAYGGTGGCPPCKLCREKDHTISALERTVSGYERLIGILEGEVSKLEVEMGRKSPIKQTG